MTRAAAAAASMLAAAGCLTPLTTLTWLPPAAAVLPAAILLGAAALGRVLPGRRLRGSRLSVTGPVLIALIALPLLVAGLLSGPTDTPVARCAAGLARFGSGWRDIVASPMPIAATCAGLGALAVTVWVGTVIAVAAALAGAARLVPVLPVGVVFVAAALVTVPAPPQAGWVVAVAGGVLVQVAVSRPDSAGQSRGGVLRAVPVIAVALGVGLLAGQLVTTAPDDPRGGDTAPVVAVPQTSPLVWVAAWQAAPSAEVFDYTGDLGREGSLRWVSLDAYDGTSWTSTAQFGLAGATIADPRPGTGPRLTGTVTDLRLPGPWLPVPDRPVAVTTPVRVDPGSGDLAVPTYGSVGVTYTVQAQTRAVDEQTLREVTQVARPPMTLPPGVGAGFAATATSSTAGAASDFDRLLLLQDWVRAKVRLDRTAVPGQSARMIDEVISGKRAGTADQIVSGYALLAGSLGYPTRVVVGFTPSAGQHSSWTVHSTDIVAWPEIWLDGVGWQPFYPVPLRDSDSTDTVVRQQVATTAAVVHPDAARPRSAAVPDIVAPQRTSQPPWVPVGLATGIVAIAVVTGWRVARRRWARRTGTPSERVLHAWRHLQHKLSRAGVPAVAALTCEETVAAAIAVHPDRADDLRDLGDLVTGLLFAGRSATDDQARRSWQLTDSLGRARLRVPTRGGLR